MTETYEDKLDSFSRGKSFLKLRGGVPNSTGELCEACGSGQPGTLFGIRELVTGLDHFVGYNCLRELMRRKVVLQSRVRETSEQAFAGAQKGKESSGNGRLGQGREGKLVSNGNALPRKLNEGEISSLPMLGEGTRHALPPDLPVIATPTLVVWETEDAFRAAVQIHGEDGLAWGAAEQPKRRQVLALRPGDGFLLTREERYDRAALARCVRLATRNAYLTLESHLAGPGGNEEGTLATTGANDG
jgi:hypothetical protein